eukprot:NODE_2588_length_898_cov_103.036514_g1063_i2.p1 GENE.NODE_2588_length_898_cov_103.036514_g1063_i2~~NODE_2588_length_898_cov_103.036514_g1063_i2.p1  ORF type:complete len:258 (+),score=7.36 NODE_2588_length_898_cov_103.036514_g1063_i2:52-825(+)
MPHVLNLRPKHDEKAESESRLSQIPTNVPPATSPAKGAPVQIGYCENVEARNVEPKKNVSSSSDSKPQGPDVVAKMKEDVLRSVLGILGLSTDGPIALENVERQVREAVEGCEPQHKKKILDSLNEEIRTGCVVMDGKIGWIACLTVYLGRKIRQYNEDNEPKYTVVMPVTMGHERAPELQAHVPTELPILCIDYAMKRKRQGRVCMWFHLSSTISQENASMAETAADTAMIIFKGRDYTRPLQPSPTKWIKGENAR